MKNTFFSQRFVNIILLSVTLLISVISLGYLSLSKAKETQDLENRMLLVQESVQERLRTIDKLYLAIEQNGDRDMITALSTPQDYSAKEGRLP